MDRRDNPIFPNHGTLFKLSQEFAGLGGNIGFFKNELELQANLPLAEDISLQGSFNGGLLKDLQGDKTFNISDHFFLGKFAKRSKTVASSFFFFLSFRGSSECSWF